MSLICRACGLPHLSDLGPCAQYPVDASVAGPNMEPGRLYRCQKCGFGQRVPYPDEETLARAYRQTGTDAMVYAFEENAAWTLAREILVANTNRPVVRVLDVGSHTGLFLAGLPPAWKRHGVESASGPCVIATTAHGVKIIADRIESVQVEWDGQFDVVTLFDVFEHLVFPMDGLRRAVELLRPGGRLVISTGDMDAWTWRVAVGEHWYLQTPLHLSFGSKSFFRQLGAHLPAKLRHVTGIPHQHRSASWRLREAVELLHWTCRQRGGWLRIPQRVIQSAPGFRHLRHRLAPPWTMSLKDHVLVVYERNQPESI